jgi:RNA polymerase sigma-70 factor (ECF subfamily)
MRRKNCYFHSPTLCNSPDHWQLTYGASASPYNNRFPGLPAWTMMQKNTISTIDPKEIEWIQETLAGSTRSFDTIVLKYQDQVYHFILKAIGDRADAEDLAQNVFFNAFTNLKKFRNKSSLKTWLFSIAINQMRNYWRSKKHAVIQTESELQPLADAERVYLHNAIDAGPDQEVGPEETRRIVDTLIAYLPPAQKEIFVLYYLLGHSCEEISKITKASPAKIKIQLFRGRKRLFEKFKDLLK